VARVSQTRDPTTSTTSYAPPPHSYETSLVAFSRGATETEPQRLGFGIWTKTCSPPPVSRTRDPTTTTTSYRPPPHRYATSPVAVSHGATETEPQRLGFGIWTKSRSLPPVPRTHDPATSTTSYRPPPHPYATSPVAVSHGTPETEPQRLGFGFCPQTHSPPRISRTHNPTTTTTSSAPLHHLPSLFFTSISIGAPAIELQWLSFRFLALFLIF
jgi:hypothetical protein